MATIFKTFNSHVMNGKKCVEIVETLHIKLSSFGCREPSRNVTVNYKKGSSTERPDPTKGQVGQCSLI